MSSRQAAANAVRPPSAAPARADRLRLGGLVPLSSCDYPDKLSAVVFCQGCPWRCRYCHNPHLQPARSAREVAWNDVRQLLERRRGLLDAVVFTGGEPTAQAALTDAMKEARDMGYRVALHTAGIYPRRFERALEYADWVGLDVKADAPDYDAVTGVAHSDAPVFESLALLLASGVPHEVRTTVHASLVTAGGLTALASKLAQLGVRQYVLQEFRRDGCADEALANQASPALLSDGFCRHIAAFFSAFEVRRA